ncbi:conserved phage C-terminal domain-containing protein [Enterococcus sp. AZ126]|uniref:conserved phage C-terminal domain-containing protein n=1 Tax=Enterococcus sp. AZ126 TaxID=2774635 RepID=UPI003F20AC04
MSDKQKKRYYWLKLKENFFEEDTIEWLEEQTNGKEYCLIYLKLCLKSLKTDGILARNVGNMLIPYDAETLSKITNSTVDTIKVAMDIFKKIGLIQILDGGEIYINQLNELVGSETEYAKQKRLQRAKTDNVQTLSSGCLENVAQSIELEKELEIRDKSIDILSDSSDDVPTEPPIYKKVIDYLNLKAKTSYRYQTKATQQKIKARLAEGFSEQDFYTVVDKKTQEWLDDADMQKFLRPETLFGTKFESYLNQLNSKPRQQGSYQRQSIREETMPESVTNPTPEAKLSKEEQAALDAQIAAWEASKK